MDQVINPLSPTSIASPAYILPAARSAGQALAKAGAPAIQDAKECVATLSKSPKAMTAIAFAAPVTVPLAVMTFGVYELGKVQAETVINATKTGIAMGTAVVNATPDLVKDAIRAQGYVLIALSGFAIFPAPDPAAAKAVGEAIGKAVSSGGALAAAKGARPAVQAGGKAGSAAKAGSDTEAIVRATEALRKQVEALEASSARASAKGIAGATEAMRQGGSGAAVTAAKSVK